MGRREGVHSGTGAVLRALKRKIGLERLRQLWMQCDMFDAVQERATASVPPRQLLPPPGATDNAPPAERVRKAPRVPHTHRDDMALVEQLSTAHAEYNSLLFAGALTPVGIRVSRRMKNRLGHYMAAGAGLPAEIAISRKHIRRDQWDDVLHTLVHEMVHQWQDENGHALDHGPSFRRKAREVGISARATRPATPTVPPRMAARAMHRPRS